LSSSDKHLLLTSRITEGKRNTRTTTDLQSQPNIKSDEDTKKTLNL